MAELQKRGPIAFSRASSATYVGADGVLKTAARDEPRFVADPAGGTLLLLEDGGSNLLKQSQALTTSSTWLGGAGGKATIAMAYVTAPDGTLTAQRMTDTITTNLQGLAQSVPIPQGGSACTASVFFKAGTSSVASVRTYMSGGATVIAEGVIDLTSGAAQWRTTTAGARLEVIALADGWYRLCVTAVDNASGNTAAGIDIRPAFAKVYGPTADVTATGDVLVWGAQLEVSAQASSYIPTTTAAATRAPDVATFYDGPHLLPPNATPQERALDYATARVGAVKVPIRDAWNPDTCPAEMLTWLAWAFGVDEWSADWSDETKRDVIRNAVMVQRRKGSIWSIKRAISAAGYGDATLVEGTGGHWAKYNFTLPRPISNAQAAQVRRILDATAPARCWLYQLNFTAASNLYNNTIRYDGTYNHGTA